MRTRKTRDEWQMWSNYGDGWQEETAADTYREIRQLLREYRDNCPGASFRVKLARVPITPEG
jgi:hypothetical protein